MLARGLLPRSTVIALALTAGTATGAEIGVPAYVGSAACAGCHAEITGRWSGSDHHLAWTEPSEATVLGDFDDAVFEHKGVTTRFTRGENGAFVIETEDGTGEQHRFEVAGVAGIRPLQQYLLSPGSGRTQAFDVAWDVERERWYHLYPDQELPPGDGLHWTGPYKSWEARCAECHATGYVRNYDRAARTYAPHMAEIGVGCEACHGPGQAHVAWTQDPTAAAMRWPGLTAAGLTVDLGASAEAQIQQCAGCHSRREAFSDGNPVPGTPYHDAFALALLRGGLYHPDGSIQDEVYEIGSFLQSRMYARGVRCSHCHDPHSTELVAEGNAVCTQCHSPAGNSRFPTLPLKAYDDPSHHFHPDGGEGAQCRSCHMIERAYMGIDRRRDHSFRVPRPDLAESGAPDACTDCHEDRDAAWAAAEIARRFPGSDRRGPHFATTFAAARWEPAAQADALMALAADSGQSGIVRATALELLVPVADPALADRAAPLLADPDPLVRAAAAGVQRGLPPEARLERLAPALEDPLRAVRVAAARTMLDAPATGGGSEAGKALQGALAEWGAAALTRLDFPETHLQLAGAALAMRDLGSAEGAFLEAVDLDPQLVDGWVMVARIRATTGDLDGAAQALSGAVTANPDHAGLRALQAEVEAARQ